METVGTFSSTYLWPVKHELSEVKANKNSPYF